jgi:hypothetical protein
MAKAKPRRKKKLEHGGRRKGSGRKPLEGGGSKIVPVSLTPAHIEKVERWRTNEQPEKNFSAAVREMIDAADQAGPRPAP